MKSDGENDIAVRVTNLRRTFGNFVAVDDISLTVEKRRDLRVSRTKWGRKINDHQDAVRPPRAHRRSRHCGWF